MHPTQVHITNEGEAYMTTILLNGMPMLVSRYAVSSAEPWNNVHIELDIPVDSAPLSFTGIFMQYTDADYAVWQQFLAGRDPHTTPLLIRFLPGSVPCEIRLGTEALRYMTHADVRSDADEGGETWVRLEGYPTEPQDDSPPLVVTGTLHHA